MLRSRISCKKNSCMNSYRYLGLLFLLLVFGLPVSAKAQEKQQLELMTFECAQMLNSAAPSGFRNIGEEINFYAQILGCDALNRMNQTTEARTSLIGPGMDMIANPAWLPAYAFSTQQCEGGAGDKWYFACWVDKKNSAEGISLEEAIRREYPKQMMAEYIKGRGNKKGVVRYILCPNLDPAKPVQNNPNCRDGQVMTLTEYGRGDMNKDGLEDVLLMVKHGNLRDAHRVCYNLVLTRKHNELLKVVDKTRISGVCE